MKNTQHKKIFVCLITLFSLQSFGAPDYYKCSHAVGGEWNYGRAPKACDASSFGDDSVVYQDYFSVIFDDNTERASERNRYMQELHSVIREGAKYYLSKRKPAVSDAELNAWILGIVTTASQESYWSHYRKATDSRLKMMRGDYGHGHGLMQVDDRSHFNAIEQGLGWNLAGHMAYAMDIFYSAWEKALSKGCISSNSDYTGRIRSAWSAYNGGPSQACRWKNSSGAWAQNDKNFYTQLTSRRWKNYVANELKPSSIDIGCLMEKSTNCAGPSPVEPPNEPLQDGVLYSTGDRYCALKDQTAHCVQESRDRVCLKAHIDFNADKSILTTNEKIQQHNPQNWDRHELCKMYEPSLFQVGENIQIKKNTNLRASPGTGILIVVPANTILSVVDFEILSATTRERYYRVSYKGKTGFLYAGTQNDWASWATNSAVPALTVTAKAGDLVRIVTNSGTNMRNIPSGPQVLTVVASNAIVQVIEVVIQGSDNEVYYKVSYNGQTGYIYSGKLLPQNTVKTWTIVQE